MCVCVCVERCPWRADVLVRRTNGLVRSSFLPHRRVIRKQFLSSRPNDAPENNINPSSRFFRKNFNANLLLFLLARPGGHQPVQPLSHSPLRRQQREYRRGRRRRRRRRWRQRSGVHVLNQLTRSVVGERSDSISVGRGRVASMNLEARQTMVNVEI